MKYRFCFIIKSFLFHEGLYDVIVRLGTGAISDKVSRTSWRIFWHYVCDWWCGVRDTRIFNTRLEIHSASPLIHSIHSTTFVMVISFFFSFVHFVTMAGIVMVLLSVTNWASWKISLTTVRIELASIGLLVQCSTNWATRSRRFEYVIFRICDNSYLMLYSKFPTSLYKNSSCILTGLSTSHLLLEGCCPPSSPFCSTAPGCNECLFWFLSLFFAY